MIRLFQFISLVVVFVMVSCSDDTNPRLDEQSFTKLYDNNKFNSSYTPIDIKQTADKGYIIVASRVLKESNYRGIYLMKVDSKGNFIKEVEVDPMYVNPVAKFMGLQDEFYFFCMMELSQATQLVKISSDLESIEFSEVGKRYPFAGNMDGNSFVLSTYDDFNKLSEISLVNSSGGILATKSFSIGVGEDIEEPIINHFIKGGTQLPFSVGRIPGGAYYFNGFYNYTFSLVFTDFVAEDPTGVVQGQQEGGGLSAIMPISANKFAAARFNFGDNFIIPNATLSSSSITSSVNLGGNTFPELVPNAHVRIIHASINSKNILIYASDTKSSQIGLYFYDESTGAFIASEYLGFSNPFEIASLIQTEDEGLVVCGTTNMAGRFPRPTLFKLSKEKLKAIIN